MLPKWISDATVDDLDELKETIEMLYVAMIDVTNQLRAECPRNIPMQQKCSDWVDCVWCEPSCVTQGLVLCVYAVNARLTTGSRILEEGLRAINSERPVDEV